MGGRALLRTLPVLLALGLLAYLAAGCGRAEPAEFGEPRLVDETGLIEDWVLHDDLSGDLIGDDVVGAITLAEAPPGWDLRVVWLGNFDCFERAPVARVRGTPNQITEIVIDEGPLREDPACFPIGGGIANGVDIRTSFPQEMADITVRYDPVG